MQGEVLYATHHRQTGATASLAYVLPLEVQHAELALERRDVE